MEQIHAADVSPRSLYLDGLSLFLPFKVVTAAIGVTGLGFLLFWTTQSLRVGLVGLFITGLGVASLYPLILSLAIEAAGDNAVQASARATLASGAAVLILPLALGRLADLVGIRPAYGVVGILVLGLLLMIVYTQRTSPAITTQPVDVL